MSTELEVSRRARFDFVRYASVWEDADVLCEALAPVAAGGKLLSIASAGDNALALLTLNPREVVAVDLNPAQLACLELRVAAFRSLDDAGVLRFLGAHPDPDRGETYRALRPLLSEPARRFWDARPAVIQGGVIHSGRFEGYLRGFRRWVLPLVHTERTIQSLLHSRTRQEREQFYRDRWDTPRWRGLFRLFFSRTLLGRGRDPAFLKHVTGPVAERLLGRTRYAFTELPTHSNPYLGYIVRGSYAQHALPRYLRPEWMPVIRERLERLRLHLGAVHQVPEGDFDGLNLSDIFEYQSPAEHRQCYGELLRRCSPGARLVYWNMLAPRACPEEARRHAQPLADLATTLHARDQAWFYSALHIDEVRAGGGG